ncbi:uncharacterized protein LOC135194964 [Macrobrachium nipponense]|uniref:uncharacterized protein LOC135194964 n=1 Tax=Macrobrachium nipponense TaxID=159736 RepID=UPI0030C7A4C0
MEEEVEYAGQREDFLSEDDHSPTDASEDSVEVKVTPIKTHYRHSSPLSRPPSAAHHHHHHLLPSSPFKGATIAAAAHHHHHRPRSPPTHKFYHNFRKHAHAAAAVVAVDPCKERRSPPEDYDFGSSRGGSPPPLPAYYDEIKHSPQDFSTTTASTTGRASPRVISPPIPASNAHARPAPSPPASPLEPPTGAAPWSPGTRGAAAARSRRKPAEPRRLCHEGNNNHHNNNNNNNISSNNNKRCHSPDAPHRKSAKVARTDGSSGVGVSVSVSDDKSVGSSPSPGAPPLLAHHPLLGPLARPPMGAFPPLLLPPAWPPAVAAQWGYPRVVTPLGWAGLTPGLTPHPYPMLLPHHYPLGRPLIHPHLHPASPPSPKSPPPPPPPRPPSEEQVKEELPIPLVTKVPHPDPPLSSSSTSSSTTHHLHHHHHHHAHHPLHSHPHPITREVSVVKKIGKAPSKFLSVESLIASDSSSTSSPSRCPRPSETVRSATSSAPKASSAPAPAPATEVDDELLLQTSAGLGGDDDDTIHTLLQPNKQKQRNYKNMTRERRIEANARERNRVHTISAAFEKLRTSVPAYSHNQKLSKLSVLRIACSYILLLSRLAGHDYSEGGTEPSLGECVDLTTRTIQVEGKAKKKRDE